MKKLLIITVLAFTCLTVTAQRGKAVKYIRKYDVQATVRQLPKNRPADFWNTIQMNNKRVLEIINAIESQNKTATQAADQLIKACEVLPYYDNLANGYEELPSRIARDLGIEKEHQKRPVRIIQDQSVNASMDAIGQMRINVGAIEAFTYEELLAVCAHEAAHYACLHPMDRAWKGERKRRRNRFWAELETGLLIGAAAASGAYGIANGVDIGSANTILANADYFLEASYADAERSALRFHFRYSRDEEIEADIIAYRFMEYMGYGTDHWISAMRMLASMSTHTEAGKYDDHPLPSFRLEVLQALKDNAAYQQKK